MGKRKSYKKKKRNLILSSDKNLFFDGSYIPNNNQMAGLETEIWGNNLPSTINSDLGKPMVTEPKGGTSIKAGGGNIGAPDVAGAINGTLGVIDAVSDISTIKDTSGYEDQLKNESTLLQNAANQTFSAGSTEDLMSKFNNATKIGDIEQTESLGMDAIAGSKKENMQTAGRAIGSGASTGAAIGSMFGPWGIAIGAGAGALIEGISAWFGNSKKKKKAAEKQKQLEAERQELAIQRRNAANQQIANLAESSTNLQSDMAFNAMANYAKYGGLFNSEGLIDAGKGQTFIGSAVKKYEEGGPTNKKEIIYSKPEDPDGVIVPMDVVKVAPKPFAPSPTIVEHTGSNKLLPNEATPRNFLIGTNDEGEESQRYKIYKVNLEQFLGREVSDEEAKKKLEEGVARMEAAPASVIQYSNMFKMPWHATLTTADKLSPYTVSREATREGDKGNDGYFTSFNYENLTQNPEELVDNTYIKPGHIGYLQIEPGSPEWETLTAHERAHALMLKAAEATIAGRNIKPVSGEYDPDYWDDAKEIYARVKSMQVSEKMDPNKEYSAKEIRDILKNKKDKYKLDRYSDEDLEFIFNKVAYNPSNLNIEVPEQMKYTDPSEGVSLAAYGGPLFKEFNNGITIINEGGTHEDNPFEGVQVGVDPQGTPNLVEEGEVIFNDYVFSNRLTVPNKVRSKYKLRNNKKLSFADAAKDIQKMSEEMPNDPIVKRTMELRMNQLMQEQEMIRQKKNEYSGNTFSDGGEKNQKKFNKASKRASKRFGIDLGEYTEDWQNSDAYKDYLSANKVRNSNLTGLGLQAAPALGSLLAVGNDIFGGNEADLSTVDAYKAAINNAYKPIGTVKAHTISDYMQYNPYDTARELNALNASQAASRNALMNTSGGNSAAARAAILASDYNYGNQIGDTYRRAQEYNDANRERVIGFNRGTNQYNAQALDSANARNAQIAQFNAQQDNARAGALFNAGRYRDALIQANRAEKSGNLTGLYEGLAGLGETIYNMGNTKYLQDNKVLVDETGNIKGGNTAANTTTAKTPAATSSVAAPIYYTEGDPASERAYLEARKEAGYSKGGKLKRKTKRRRLS